MEKDQLDDLDCESWMESLGTSHKRNDGVDERLRSVAAESQAAAFATLTKN